MNVCYSKVNHILFNQHLLTNKNTVRSCMSLEPDEATVRILNTNVNMETSAYKTGPFL